ncbi:MAG: hypothetical protein BGO25_18130 [Acidobacteriales bacterium 59-55]|nr:hypothetical protein [Terriglobales bacterium]OJV41594.1 MAG: hypothetical protein BGO25_18130 [Acidobacteriales bacterium 59-55]
MKRINTSYFYRLAEKLIPLHGITTEMTLVGMYGELFQAEEALRIFAFNDTLPPITSYSSCSELLSALQEILKDAFRDQQKFTYAEVQALNKGLERFEISLQSDFGTRDTFIVSPKAAYSTTLLAERGETVLSDAVYALVPSIKQDMASGCRCLAFELSTAAAFHFFRAVEAMVRTYAEFVRQKPFTEAEKKRGLGGYSNLLKQQNLGVDPRITTSIDQISSLHRNPTMHPDMHISSTEIMATIGMVVSVIETITVDWNRRKSTPEIPLVDLLPDDSKVSALLEDGSEETKR